MLTHLIAVISNGKSARPLRFSAMLKSIEQRILELHNGISLDATAERLAEIGRLLAEAKAQLPHGKFLPWVKRLGMRPRTAQLYVQCWRYCEANTVEGLSLSAFLRLIRQSKRAARAQERAELRAEAIQAAGAIDGRFIVQHADCRRFRWPRQIDAIATDPPWDDKRLYRWLGKFAAERLKPGGPLFVQCGTMDLPEVTDILRAAGLTYVWMLAIVYDQPWAKVGQSFNVSWRPVLMFSQGPWSGCTDSASDAYTVANTEWQKQLHDWQQPLPPWQFWLSAFTRPGDLICDPFSGSGTIGLATKLAGGRQFLGTEIDEETAAIAQGRINRKDAQN